jgi:hypothetical protein
MVLAIVDVLAWLGAAVLVAAGVLKLRSPRPAAGFLVRLGLPASAATVRVAAVLEIAAGAAVLVSGDPAALAAAGSFYSAFLGALARHRLRTGERTVSCGCFGSSAAVPVVPHATALAIVLSATGVAAAAGRDAFASVLAALAPADVLLLLVLLGLAVTAALGYSTAGSTPIAGTQFTLTIERRGER